MTTILMGISKGAGRFFSQLIEKSKDGEYDLGPNLEPHPGWKSCKHLVALNFGRGKTQYILRQDGTNAVYINPINEMGGVSPVPSDKAQWKSHYPNLFSYRVGDKVFLGGQNDTNGFFLQEILPDGKFGKTTTFVKDKKWEDLYATLGHVKINGQHYLYGQSNNSNNRFFVQTLTHDGTLGAETCAQTDWKNFYSSMGTVIIDDQTFLFAQTKNHKRFFIQKLNENGVLEDHVFYSSNFGNFYDSLGSLYLDGKPYIHGSSVRDKTFFVQEICMVDTQEIKLGNKIIKEQEWGYGYDDVVSLNIENWVSQSDWMDGVYKQLSEEKQKTITLKDFCMPASHDAGMYKISRFSFQEPWSLTQSSSIKGQLDKGVRYFDFRINDKSDDDFRFEHGAWGPNYKEALIDIKAFMENSNETVILAFTHFDDFKKHTQTFIDDIQDYLGPFLLERAVVDNYFAGAGHGKVKSINNLPYSMLRGKIILFVESSDFESKKKLDLDKIRNTNNIFLGWTFSDNSRAPSYDSYINIYDSYADTADFKKMWSDQEEKYLKFGKGKKPNLHDENSLMAVDWTLTPGVMTPADYAIIANPALLESYHSQTGPFMAFMKRNPQERLFNFLSLDYVPSGVANICYHITLTNNA